MANPVKVIKGAAKAITAGKKKAVQKANRIKTAGKGAVYLDKKNTMREYMSDAKVKGRTRDFKRSAKPVNPALKAEFLALGLSKRKFNNARGVLADRFHSTPSRDRSLRQQSAAKYQGSGGRTVPVKKKGK
jgi:hypothetical protein